MYPVIWIQADAYEQPKEGDGEEEDALEGVAEDELYRVGRCFVTPHPLEGAPYAAVVQRGAQLYRRLAQ